MKFKSNENDRAVQSYIPINVYSPEWEPFYRNKQYFAFVNHDNPLYNVTVAIQNQQSLSVASLEDRPVEAGSSSRSRTGSFTSTSSAKSSHVSEEVEQIINRASSYDIACDDKSLNEIFSEGATSPSPDKEVLQQQTVSDSMIFSSPSRNRMSAIVRMNSSDVSLKTTASVVPSWAREHAKIDCEVSVKLMDSLWNATFYEFVKDEQNVDCVARHLISILKDMDMPNMCNGILWLIKGWGIDSVACLLKRLTADWEPDRAAVLVGHLTVGWPIRPSLCLLLALLLYGEPPQIVGVFLYSFSRAWSTGLVTQLISYLDVVLEWSTDYFKDLTKKYIQLACGAVLQSVEARVAKVMSSDDELAEATVKNIEIIQTKDSNVSEATIKTASKLHRKKLTSLPNEALAAELFKESSSSSNTSVAQFSSKTLVLQLLQSMSSTKQPTMEKNKQKHSAVSFHSKDSFKDQIGCSVPESSKEQIDIVRISIPPRHSVDQIDQQQPFPVANSRPSSVILKRKASNASTCTALSLENLLTALAQSSTSSLSNIP